MYKIVTLLILVISFTIGFIFTGCGDDAITPQTFATATPAGTATATAKIPLHNPPLKMLRAGEEGGGLFSSLIDTINDGLKDGVTSWIGDNTTGRVLDIIGSKLGLPGADAELDEINDKLNQIIGQLNDIEAQLSALQTQLTITQVDLQNYISSTSLQQYITVITTKFDTTDTTGLMYYSQQGSQLDPNEPNSPAAIALKNNAAAYVLTNTGVLEGQVQGIHDAICPDLSTLNGVLKDYADKIILNPSTPNSNLSDPNNAMATYLLLESYFAQILNYQTKACVIVTEINNYKDPNGVQGIASSYLNGTYKQILKDEIIKYEQTVNYLVVNMTDYRSSSNYVSDNASGYPPAQGIAQDNTHLMVLARSRFFCAQVMNAFESDFGLYGAIVTPYDYSPGINSPVTSLTLQFSGPTTFTTTVKAQNILGVYPYTKWTGSSASPDNNWSFYDFSTFRNPNIGDPNVPGNFLDPNLPGGTYNVTLVDNGNTDTPWRHSSTNLGKVNILYYDPNNPDPNNATTSPTQTNTVKFGYFSGRWNWGFQACSQSTKSYWQYSPYNTGVSGAIFYPPEGDTYVKELYIFMPYGPNAGSHTNKELQSFITFPFSTNSQSSIVYYNILVDYMNIHTGDGGATNELGLFAMIQAPNSGSSYCNMVDLNYSHDDSTISNAFYSGASSSLAAKSYWLSIGGTISTYGTSKDNSNGTIDAYWGIQPVFTNTYNIFQ